MNGKLFVSVFCCFFKFAVSFTTEFLCFISLLLKQLFYSALVSHLTCCGSSPFLFLTIEGQRSQFSSILLLWGHGNGLSLIPVSNVKEEGPPGTTAITLSRRQMKLCLASFVFSMNKIYKVIPVKFQRTTHSQEMLGWSNLWLEKIYIISVYNSEQLRFCWNSVSI